jgi:hypothetical protein
MPKASAPKFHQSNGSQLNNALLALRKHSRVLRHRRAFADCFGANPVASALGNRARRDPGTAVQPYHEGLKQTFETGTFYLAGIRNFLFGSDRAGFIRSLATLSALTEGPCIAAGPRASRPIRTARALDHSCRTDEWRQRVRRVRIVSEGGSRGFRQVPRRGGRPFASRRSPSPQNAERPILQSRCRD